MTVDVYREDSTIAGRTYSVCVNDVHVWRCDRHSQANLMAGNLAKALGVPAKHHYENRIKNFSESDDRVKAFVISQAFYLGGSFCITDALQHLEYDEASNVVTFPLGDSNNRQSYHVDRSVAESQELIRVQCSAESGVSLISVRNFFKGWDLVLNLLPE